MNITANIHAKQHDFSLSLSGELDSEGFFVGSGSVLRDGKTLGEVEWDGEDFIPGGLLLLPSIDDSEDVYATLAAKVREHVRTAKAHGARPQQSA